MFKRIINITLWTIVGVFILLISLLHVPVVQSIMGEKIAYMLSQKLGTEVSIGRVNVGLINRFIIDDVDIHDQQGQPLLSASRLSAKIDILPLMQQKITVSSSQIFGLKLNLYKENANSAPNYKFLIDSLSSKKTDKKSSLNLSMNSLIFRHGEIRYRQKDKSASMVVFNPYNVWLKNISGHIVVNLLTNDSIDAKVKKLSFDEASGLHLSSLSLDLNASRSGFSVNDISLSLPNTHIIANSITAIYKHPQSLFALKNAEIKANIKSEQITVSDFSFLNTTLKNIDESFSLFAKISGQLPQIRADILQIGANNGMFALSASGEYAKVASKIAWNARVSHLKSDVRGMKLLAQVLGKKDVPEQLLRLEEVRFSGNANGDSNDLSIKGLIETAAGDANVDFNKHDKQLFGRIITTDFNLQKITNNSHLGRISAELEVSKRPSSGYEGSGKLSRFDYNNYTYSDATFNATYDEKGGIAGNLAINDDNANINVSGKTLLKSGKTALEAQATVRNLDLAALHLSNKWADTKFNADINAEIGDLKSAFLTGNIDIQNFLMQMPDNEYRIDNLTVSSLSEGNGQHRISVNSDFGEISLVGRGDIKSLPESVARLVGGKLYILAKGVDKHTKLNNEFAIDATINDTEWLKYLLGIPLHIDSPLTINGNISDRNNTIDLSCGLKDFTYADKLYRDAAVEITTSGDTIASSVKLKKISDSGTVFSWNVGANVSHNQLATVVGINDNENHPLRGEIKANTRFLKETNGTYSALINVEESDMHIGDTIWHIRPSNIIYKKENLCVNDFSLSHGDQYLRINGRATSDRNDTLHVDFKDLNVGYILDLVNFHSVEFDGQASGNFIVAGAFNKRPLAKGQLQVNDFLLEQGRMGVLNASLRYDDIAGRININATADDKGFGYTDVTGYISPVHNHISLDIEAHDTRLEFMESFCGSFMDNVNAHATGKVRLSGALNDINLTGQLVASGSMNITSLNTTYTMRGDTVRFIPNEIEFRRDTIYDRDGNIGIVNGNLHHEHLTNLSYDLNVSANKMLCFDTTPQQGESFYGTVYATGNCRIKGGHGEVVMDIDATPNKSTIITYNIDAQETENANEFLIWKKRDDGKSSVVADKGQDDSRQQPTADDDESDIRHIATDIKLNFLINCTPEATMKVIMDNASGDYIALNGDGTLRATYYNKGSLDIFGNYVVDHGLYKLTIQNVVRKDFTFEKGGTIKFGGDPFKANLDLRALYVLNSVSLSDLNIGRSFSNNNVKVNCLMNIGGTAEEPRITFDLDMPTLENDARQMVASVINAEEGMNQQVLYLLAVGRFYTQGNNNASPLGSATQRNQASLAMQSILSGTISQQINSILGTMMNNDNWNFGANISTGTEGFNDAEYEGILSGSLLNNRLLLNGQFGYRDNANATTSFIGDFDLKYLLFPNGNLAINVYNKTNDRYFTRNSLNTQGIGLIMKKDFNGIYDLFGIKKKKAKEKANK